MILLSKCHHEAISNGFRDAIVTGGKDAAIESLHLAQRTLEREVGATFNSHQRVAKGDSFVEEVLKPEPVETSLQESDEKSQTDSVSGLFDMLSENDITASTSGEDVTEQKHVGSGAGRSAEDMEDSSEIGFSKTSADETNSKGLLHSKADLVTTLTTQLSHTETRILNASAASNTSSVTGRLSEQHLKIFVADVGPKYNLEIFEAVHGLGDLMPEVNLYSITPLTMTFVLSTV